MRSHRSFLAAALCLTGLALAACGSSSGTAAPTTTAAPATGDTAAPVSTSASTDAPPATESPAPPASGDTATTATPATGEIAGYTVTGTIVADDGFRPSKDGFGFQNYGPLPAGTSNLTAEDMRQLFGDGVCAATAGGTCDLNPSARAWMDEKNGSMKDGHCYGFAVASQLLWKQKGVSANQFGGTDTRSLAITDNQALSRQLARNFVYQSMSSVQNGAIGGTPNDIVDVLRKALVPDPTEFYVLGVLKGDGGHAITPYALEDLGNGIVNILVYDNNYPGETRAVKVDTNANSFEYTAQLNPDGTADLYTGDATHTGHIFLFPTTPALAQQPCPFCDNVPGNASGSGDASTPPAGTTSGILRSPTAPGAIRRGEEPDTIEISLDGQSTTAHGHLLITNPDGKRLGWVDGEVVNEIPGAEVFREMANRAVEPTYTVPDGVEYTIVLDGSPLSAPDVEEITVIAPSYEMSISDIQLNPGEQDSMYIAPYAEKLAYQASGTETPIFELGVSDESADYIFAVRGTADQAGSITTFGLPSEGGTFTIDTADSDGTSTFELAMIRIDDAGEHDFYHPEVNLATADNAVLDFGSWTTDGSAITLQVNHADGTSESTELEDVAGEIPID